MTDNLIGWAFGRLRFLRRLIGLFSAQERIGLVGLVALAVFGAALEVLGIGLIASFIGVLNDPAILQNSALGQRLMSLFGLVGSSDLAQKVGIVLLAIFIFKNVFLGFMVYVQARFLSKKEAMLSRQLFQSYMDTPYTFHMERNTADLLRNINQEVSHFFTGVLMPALSLLAEFIVLLFILALLVAVDPLVAISTLGVMGFVAAAYSVLVRRHTVSLGNRRRIASGLRIKWVQQGLGALKEAKVSGREGFFVDSFHSSSLEYVRAGRIMAVVNAAPRLVMETVAVAIMLSIVVISQSQGNSLQSVLPILTLFAMAAMRVIPSLNRIIPAINQIRYFHKAVDSVYEDLARHRVPADANLRRQSELMAAGEKFHAELIFNDVWFTYPGALAPALRGVSFSIPRGRSSAFVGPSGAGKTTVIDLMLNLLNPDSGQILVDGRTLQEIGVTWQRAIGYVPQTIYLLDDTIRQNIAFGVPPAEIDDERVVKVLAQARLDGKVSTLPLGINSMVGERGILLSGGERQRIGIARALYHHPDILVFDEATSALDNQTEREIAETLEGIRGQVTLVMIAHRLTTVRNCDRLFFMVGGTIVSSGKYDELMSTNEKFRRFAEGAESGGDL
ncbi:MAG: ABC transporter ATP-binding protein [Rhodocyclaceae bacterium]|nr:ABC transporter ATP-binding protein [Rhodocyclaceae bacterium]